MLKHRNKRTNRKIDLADVAARAAIGVMMLWLAWMTAQLVLIL
jgi:hypothetical protein